MGTLVNVKELMNNLIRMDLPHLNTTSDSEILLHVMAYELQRSEAHLCLKQLFKAMTKLYKRVQGSVCCAVMIINGYDGCSGFSRS